MLFVVFVYWGFFFLTMIHQLKQRYVVKQQYNPSYALYLSPSQPRFHSCQKLYVALPWLRSIGYKNAISNQILIIQSCFWERNDKKKAWSPHTENSSANKSYWSRNVSTIRSPSGTMKGWRMKTSWSKRRAINKTSWSCHSQCVDPTLLSSFVTLLSCTWAQLGCFTFFVIFNEYVNH